MVNVAIGLGSNRGDCLAYLRMAYHQLGEILVETQISRVYRTPPVGNKEQPRYLNAVVVGISGHSAQDLHTCLKEIEFRVGRTRFISGEPREIDLDLLFYGDQVVSGEYLCVPHPRLHERWFVLQPLCELWPDAWHPRLQAHAIHLLRRQPKPPGAAEIVVSWTESNLSR